MTHIGQSITDALVGIANKIASSGPLRLTR